MSKPSLSDVSIHAWILEYGIKNERGEPITFDDHLYLYDIYKDESPRLCVLKAAQVGLSVLETLKMFWISKHRAMDIVYTLPTETDVQTFVGGKANRLIAQNPILQEYCNDKDSIFQKAVGDSVVYFRGCTSKKMATMVTADWLIHDELDSSNFKVVEMYQSRLQHSKHKWIHSFSHPFVPGVGVDLDWQRSDKKHWFITPDCGHEQFMEWPASVDFEKRCFVCKECGKEMGKKERTIGEWKPTAEGEWSGYWVNLMMCNWVTADEMIVKWEDPDTTKEFFYNMMLGLPYESSDGNISRKDLFANLTDKMNSQEGIVIGCDSGLKKHFVVGNREGIFFYGKTEDWEDIETLLQRDKKAILVVDALPDLTAPRKLREKYKGRVYLSFYNEDKKSFQLVRWGSKKERGIVHIDRNRMITHIVEEFKDKVIPLQGTKEDWEDYVCHWENVYRVKKEDKMGRPVFRWEKKTTEDHWVHSTVYWRAGVSRFGGEMATVTARDGTDTLKQEKSFVISPGGQLPLPDPKSVFIFEKEND